MERNPISRATMGRLPAYLGFLEGLPDDTANISATTIAKSLGYGEVQVRKDLASVCSYGRPKIGYDKQSLIVALEKVLGIHTLSEAIVVGAGKLGRALLGFGGFEEYGISIRVAFDTNPYAGNPSIYDISKLPKYCSEHNVEIGIITAPPQVAQQVADLLVQNGIRAIYCFATVRLQLPPNVTVQYENIALSLAHLHQRLQISQE